MSEATGDNVAVHPLLIIAHAQHPLENGVTPGEEFRVRLDLAAELYGQYSPQAEMLGAVAVQIGVLGSRHRGDKRTLSRAGREYLVDEHGIPPALVHGDAWNITYTPNSRGVYNGGDEAAVASRAYRALGFNSLIAVCSPAQRLRLILHYGSHNIRPEFKMPPVDQDVHEGLAEQILTNYTRYLNPSWQRGILPALIRWSRQPRDGQGIVSIAA